MSKYTPLAEHLARSGARTLELAFTDVDRFVIDGLPESAFRYRTWWTSGAGNSAQSRYGWLRAGYCVARMDLANRVVTFARRPAANHPAPISHRS